jgi:hypothetical protein
MNTDSFCEKALPWNHSVPRASKTTTTQFGDRPLNSQFRRIRIGGLSGLSPN